MSDFKIMHVSEAYQSAIDYMLKRRSGELPSIKTPWEKVNQATMNGLEWHSIVVVGGRPGSGKTLFTNLITREAHRLNPDQSFIVLDFQFEMLARNTALREFAATTGKTIKQLTSVYDPLEEQEMMAVRKYVQLNKDKPIYIVEKAGTVSDMKMVIEEALKIHNKPIIVTIDHSVLVQKGATEKDTFDTLHNLAKMMTDLKRRKVMFLILTQLNREVESIDRQKPGTYGNYLFDSDIYGGDALLQHADVVIGINRPSKYNLPVYGPQKYIVDKDLLCMHVLKNRNGNAPMLLFFKEDYGHMMIHEREEPPTTR